MLDKFKNVIKGSYADLFSNKVDILNADLQLEHGIPTLVNSGNIWGTLVHELTHHWCFDSPVGNALFLAGFQACSLANNRFDKFPRLRNLMSRYFQRYKLVSDLYLPMIEGLALFMEFDVRIHDGIELGDLLPPMKTAALFTRQLKDNHERWLSSTDAANKKANLLAGVPKNYFDGGAYLIGYGIVKSLWRDHCIKNGPFSDPADFVEFLRTVLFEDDYLVWLILNESDYQLQHIVEHLDRRLNWIVSVGNADNIFIEKLKVSSIHTGYLSGILLSKIDEYHLAAFFDAYSPQEYMLPESRTGKYWYGVGRSSFQYTSLLCLKPTKSEMIWNSFRKSKVSPVPGYNRGLIADKERSITSMIHLRGYIVLAELDINLLAEKTMISFVPDSGQAFTISGPNVHIYGLYAGKAKLEIITCHAIVGFIYRFYIVRNGFPTVVCAATMCAKEVNTLRHGKKITVNVGAVLDRIADYKSIEVGCSYQWKKWGKGIYNSSFNKSNVNDICVTTLLTFWKKKWKELFDDWFSQPNCSDVETFESGIYPLIGHDPSVIKSLARAGLRQDTNMETRRDSRHDDKYAVEYWRTLGLSIFPDHNCVTWL